MPDALAAADKLMVAPPGLPDVWLRCSHPAPVVSILHAALELNDKATVPPPSGIVSVKLVRVSGEVVESVFLQDTAARTANKIPKNIYDLRVLI
ncbi:MAG: hypothetical protein BGO55_04850 [Sphingobacteriales bacterium 50-39]|nr:MAG: hypothetical protein BGO55_04850 [Sphingobacteriales bacterium 50-39]